MIKRYYFTLFLAFLSAFAPILAMEFDGSSSNEDSYHDSSFYDVGNSYYSHQSDNNWWDNKVGIPEDDIIAFFDAIEKGDLIDIKTLFDKNHDIIHTTDPRKIDNLTVLPAIILSQFSEEDKLNLIVTCLAFGVKPEYQDLVDTLINTKSKTNEIMHALLSYGAPVDLGDEQFYKNSKYDPNTPNNILQCVEHNLVNYHDNKGQLFYIIQKQIHSHLLHAIKNGNTEEMRRLVNKYDIKINDKLTYYKNADYKNCINEHKKSIDPKDWPSSQVYPLLHAVSLNQDEIIKCLVTELGAYAYIQDYTNEEGYRTVFHLDNFPFYPDGSSMSIETAKLLLSRNANPNVSDKKKFNMTPLEKINWHINNTKGEYSKDAFNNLHGLRKLFDKDAEKNELAQFFQAMQNYDVDTVFTIYKSNKDIVNKVKDGKTALYAAILASSNNNSSHPDSMRLVDFCLECELRPDRRDLFDATTKIHDSKLRNKIVYALLLAGAPMERDPSYPNDKFGETGNLLGYLQTTPDNIENREKLIEIVQNHINTRLFVAILDGKELDEISRLIETYKIDINQPLMYYQNSFSYFGNPYEVDSSLEKESIFEWIPFDIAFVGKENTWRKSNHNEIIEMFLNEFNGNPIFLQKRDRSKKFIKNEQEPSVHVDPNTFNAEDAPDMFTLQDVTITDEDRKNQKPSPMPKFTNRGQDQNNQNSGIPPLNNFTPDNDPTNNPTNVITKSGLPWKLIGGGVVVVAVIIAGKKLYNWYYTKTEPEKEEAEVEQTDANAEKAAATA